MKKNNQGFSMVELIIVMVIMAILVGVLAPQYIKYVKRSKKSVDVKTIDEIEKIAILVAEDPTEYDKSISLLETGEYIITFSNREYTGMTGPEQKSTEILKKGIESHIGDMSEISLKHNGWGTLKIHFNVGKTGKMSVSCTNDGADSYEEYTSK